MPEGHSPGWRGPVCHGRGRERCCLRSRCARRVCRAIRRLPGHVRCCCRSRRARRSPPPDRPAKADPRDRERAPPAPSCANRRRRWNRCRIECRAVHTPGCMRRGCRARRAAIDTPRRPRSPGERYPNGADLAFVGSGLNIADGATGAAAAAKLHRPLFLTAVNDRVGSDRGRTPTTSAASPRDPRQRDGRFDRRRDDARSCDRVGGRSRSRPSRRPRRRRPDADADAARRRRRPPDADADADAPAATPTPTRRRQRRLRRRRRLLGQQRLRLRRRRQRRLRRRRRLLGQQRLRLRLRRRRHRRPRQDRPSRPSRRQSMPLHLGRPSPSRRGSIARA